MTLSAPAAYLAIYPKPGGTIRFVEPSQPDGVIVGRVKSVIAAKVTSNEVLIYPAETKPKSAGVYTDIPEASPLWEYISERRTRWRLQKGFQGWENNSDIISLSPSPSPDAQAYTAAEQEQVAAAKRSISTAAAKGIKQINGRLSVIPRGHERLVQAKGKDLFMQLCVDGRMVSSSNSHTSPLSWHSSDLPDGCYLVEIRAYADSQVLFTSSQILCVRNDR